MSYLVKCGLVLLIAAFTFGQDETTIDGGYPIVELTADNGLDRGQLGIVDLCPEGTFAGEFEVKYAPRENFDDTAANAVKLYCYDDNGFIGVYVTSSIGEDGDWQGIRRCDVGGYYLVGFALNVEGLVGNFDDDLGVIDVRMECDDGLVLDGINSNPSSGEEKKDFVPPQVGSYLSRNGVQREAIKVPVTLHKDGVHRIDTQDYILDGEWGIMETCPIDYKICGLQTQVEPVHAVDDDAGLCNLFMYCCHYA